MTLTEVYLKTKVNKTFSRINPKDRYVSTDYWECLYFLSVNKVTKGKPWKILTGSKDEKERFHNQAVLLVEMFHESWIEGSRSHTLSKSMRQMTGKNFNDFPANQNAMHGMLLLMSRDVISEFSWHEKKILRRHSYHKLMAAVFPYWNKASGLTFTEFLKDFLTQVMKLQKRSCHLTSLSAGLFKPEEVFSKARGLKFNNTTNQLRK